MNERLYRSRDERIIAGVAGGVAAQFRVDPSLVRILWVILIPATAGLALALYIIMAFVVPEEPAGDARWAAWEHQSGGYQWPDPAAGASGAASVAAASASTGGAGPNAVDSSAAAGANPAAVGTSGPAAAGASPSSAWVAPPTAPAPGMTPPAPTSAPNTPWAGDWRAARDAGRDARRAARAERTDGGGAVLLGLILIVVGGYFFARAYLPDIDVNRTWPIILVVLGAILLVGAIRRPSGKSS